MSDISVCVLTVIIQHSTSNAGHQAGVDRVMIHWCNMPESQTLRASLLSRREQLLDVFSSQSGDIHLIKDRQHPWLLPVK